MPGKKHVLLTGSTGMVGGEALKACLDHNEIAKVTSLTRRPSGVKHEKLKEIMVKDFSELEKLEEHFREVDLALYCLAVYQGQVSKADYRKITVDYARDFAKVLKAYSPDAVFCLFSAAGTDSKEKSRMQFARDKGAAENSVFEVDFPRAHAFRPGYIYPVVKREEPSLAYRITRRMYPVLKAIYPGGVITSEHLGRVMLKVGLEGGELQIYENKDMLKIKI